MFNMFMIVFWFAVIGVIIFAVIRFRKFNHHNASRSTNQLDFIKEQYQKGELSKEQYEQLVKELTK